MHLTNITKPRQESQLFSMGSFIQPSRKPAKGLRSPFFIERACTVLGMTIKELRSQKNNKVAARRRWAVAYVMFNEKNLKHEQIALILQLDRKSIIHGIDRATGLIDSSPEFASMVDALEMAI